jgi:hypothetical protein
MKKITTTNCSCTECRVCDPCFKQIFRLDTKAQPRDAKQEGLAQSGPARVERTSEMADTTELGEDACFNSPYYGRLLGE